MISLSFGSSPARAGTSFERDQERSLRMLGVECFLGTDVDEHGFVLGQCLPGVGRVDAAGVFDRRGAGIGDGAGGVAASADAASRRKPAAVVHPGFDIDPPSETAVRRPSGEPLFYRVGIIHPTPARNRSLRTSSRRPRSACRRCTSCGSGGSWWRRQWRHRTRCDRDCIACEQRLHFVRP